MMRVFVDYQTKENVRKTALLFAHEIVVHPNKKEVYVNTQLTEWVFRFKDEKAMDRTIKLMRNANTEQVIIENVELVFTNDLR